MTMAAGFSQHSGEKVLQLDRVNSFRCLFQMEAVARISNTNYVKAGSGMALLLLWNVHILCAVLERPNFGLLLSTYNLGKPEKVKVSDCNLHFLRIADYQVTLKILTRQ